MIIVTGGTGLLGCHLLLRLAELNKPVRVIIRKGTDPKKVLSVWKHYPVDQPALFRKFEWFEADLNNRAEVYEALEGASQVYHCAGLVSFTQRKKRPLWETNVEITGNLIDALLEQPESKLVHVSSIAAIGPSGFGETCTENNGWPVSRESVYATTKTRGELEVWRGISEGLNAVVINPSIILGPGNWKTGSAHIFDVLYKGLGFYTRGVTGYVDIRDVSEVMVRLMESTISGERFILNAANLSFQELFNKVAIALHVKAPSHYAGPLITSIACKAEWIRSLLTGKEPSITRSSAISSHAIQNYSSEKICKQLNYSFRDINETIQHTAECYLRDIK